MRILLSSIGSRGEAQPLLALAVELRSLGHSTSLCVPPNFAEWIESFGVPCIPIGPDVRKLTGGTAPAKPAKPSPAQMQQLADHMVRDQFRVLNEAAPEFDLILGAGALQIATRSVAERHDIPYVYASLCPCTLPSPDHPPPKGGTHPLYPQWLPGVINRLLWMRDERSFNRRFRSTLNEERAKLGQTPVESVRPHVFTDRPLLASDPTLSPAGSSSGFEIVQTGAWLLPDPSPLPDDLERFLSNGEPPIFFGLGSMRALEQSDRMFVEAARTLGRRAIVSRGWAGLDASDAGADCLTIGDVDHAKLFPRVAAVVHHGGAGTTTTVARAGTPQVIVPHSYDQYYWSHRVRSLGVGASGPARDDLAADALVSSLRACLRPEVRARAEELGTRIRTDGALVAARVLVGMGEFVRQPT